MPPYQHVVLTDPPGFDASAGLRGRCERGRKKEGREGRKEGRKDGRKEGRKEGKEEGRKKYSSTKISSQ